MGLLEGFLSQPNHMLTFPEELEVCHAQKMSFAETGDIKNY